jgi:Na+-transporting NADH:ubiquinone oxidoreductase subunit NqrB
MRTWTPDLDAEVLAARVREHQRNASVFVSGASSFAFGFLLSATAPLVTAAVLVFNKIYLLVSS